MIGLGSDKKQQITERSWTLNILIRFINNPLMLLYFPLAGFQSNVSAAQHSDVCVFGRRCKWLSITLAWPMWLCTEYDPDACAWQIVWVLFSSVDLVTKKSKMKMEWAEKQQYDGKICPNSFFPKPTQPALCRMIFCRLWIVIKDFDMLTGGQQSWQAG